MVTSTTNPYLEPSIGFLRSHLENAQVSKSARTYRLLHSLRVASIGRRVAESEGLDPNRLELACLLHDIGKFDATWHVDHGRVAATLVRPFLLNLGMDTTSVEEICQGIAMHTDGRPNYPEESPNFSGKIDFPEEPTILARSVGDCDNIDRFSLYRIHDTLIYKSFAALNVPRQIDFIDGYLERLVNERTYRCATRSAQRLWIEALERQESFFVGLREQLGSALPYLD